MKDLTRSHLRLEISWCGWLWEEEWCRSLFLIKQEDLACSFEKWYHAEGGEFYVICTEKHAVEFCFEEEKPQTAQASITVTTLGERNTPRWSTEIAAPVIWAPLLSTSFNRGFQAVKAIPLENLGFWKVFVVCMNMSHRSQWSAIMFPQNFRRGGRMQTCCWMFKSVQHCCSK